MGTALRKHLVSVLYSVLVLISYQPPTHAQGIVATRSSDGRVVYENAPEDAAAKTAAASASSDSGIKYWSNTEQCWKPVPPINSNSMRAAQSAAEEVRRLIRRAALRNPRFDASGNALSLASKQVQNPPAELKPVLLPQARVASVTAKPTPAPRMVAKATPARPNASRKLASAPPAGTATWIDDIVQKAALRHAVDPNLVRAIVKVESNFNPQAVSRKGAIGLMQLMPGTARSLNVSNPYDPAQNVDAGVRHFKSLLDSYNGNLELSLAAYNAGASAVHKSRGFPNYSETRNYVKRITGIYGSNTARLVANGHPPLEIKRDAQGHLSVSDIE